MKTYRSDNGTEYDNQRVNSILRKYGIRAKRSPSGIKQANGIAERENRTLMDTVRALLFDTDFDRKQRSWMWSEAVRTAAYLRNRVPNRGRTDVTLFELWFGKKPNVSHLRVFGSKAFVHVADSQRRKLDAKSIKCVFIGYDWQTDKVYRIYNHETRKVHRVGDTVIIDNDEVEKFLLLEILLIPNTNTHTTTNL